MIARIEVELAELRAEVKSLRSRVITLERENAELKRENAELKRQNTELREALDEARRAGKRQAAPFSKGPPKAGKKTPGRKPGKAYGRQFTRPIPTEIDRHVEVDCPLFCDDCGGKIRLVDVKRQYQIEVPVIRPVTTEFVIHYGRCVECGREVQGRHPEQTSDATGVGGVQLGPNLIALTTHLNKIGGMSYGKIERLMAQAFEMTASRSGLARAVLRLGNKAVPLYDQLVKTIRRSRVVYPDETSWRNWGRKGWLWAFTNPRITVYAIRRGRGFDEAAEILGANYRGVIGSDGWHSYQRFEKALRQTCLTHLLRRCREMLEVPVNASQEIWVKRIKSVLQSALALRDRRDTGTISPHGLTIARGRIEQGLDALLDDPDVEDTSLRFALHLWRHRDEIFLFLYRPDVRATNALAEQAIRPAVINRKTCAGNRTDAGARAQEVLMTVLQTCQQRGLETLTSLRRILCEPVVTPLQLSR